MMGTTTTNVWKEVSAAEPCPVCKGGQWCCVSKNWATCICRKVAGSGKRGVDRSGGEYWIHRLNGSSNGQTEWPAPQHSMSEGGGKLASADVRNEVYSLLLSHLPILGSHGKNLLQRGLDLKHAKVLGYRSLGKGRAKAVLAVIEAGLEKHLPTVPGFFIQERDGHRYWTLAGAGGIIVPIRQPKGQIVALTVRLDTPPPSGGKYRYLSSKRRGGPGPGARIHVPLATTARQTETVRVTEGAMKADITTHLSGTLTIGLSGLNWRPAAKALQKLGAKTVRLAFDADYHTNPHVARALCQLARHLAKAGFTVELETWDIADGKGIDDLLAAGKTPQVVAGKAVAAAVDEIAEAAKPADTSAGRPVIDCDCEDLSVTTPMAIKALIAANAPPTLFRFGSHPHRMDHDDDGRPQMKPMTIDRMRHSLARAAYWSKTKTIGGEPCRVSTYPPKVVVEDTLATPQLALPMLRRIVECPVFAADGTLHIEPGYSPKTHAFYHPARGFQCPPVPEKPTRQEVEGAFGFIRDELLGDFPFISETERTHAVALMLLPFARDLIPGPTPLHLIEKPSPGTGATLMVDALLFPALGRPAPAMTEGRNEEEWRKRCFAKLRSGATVANIDNLCRRLESAALSSILTAHPTWEDRLLGFSEIIRVPTTCIWIATGNNPGLSDEIARRTVRVRIDSRTDQPWLRDTFKHPDLRGWMAENRGKLVAAALTLIRAWIVAGRPAGKKILGMFDAWAQTLGGIFDVAGVSGFLGNLEEFYAEADTETAAWRAFLGAWWEKYESREEVMVADLWPIASADGLLDLGDGEKHSQTIKLGCLLRAKRDRVFTLPGDDDGLVDGRFKVPDEYRDGSEEPKRVKIIQAGTKRRAVKWRLVQV